LHQRCSSASPASTCCRHGSSPGAVKFIERVATARAGAGQETFDRVAHLLTAARTEELDRLPVVDDAIGSTRLTWLGKGPTDASAKAVKAELAKLGYLRALEAHTLDLSALPAERRRSWPVSAGA